MVEKDNRFADAEDRKGLIFQAIGAGSMCWEHIERAGIFDSDAAKKIGEDAYARLLEFDEPLLGLATTRDLLLELMSRFFMGQNFPDWEHAHDALDKMIKGIPPRVLDYRTVDA